MTGTAVTYRPATPRDARAIVRLGREQFGFVWDKNFSDVADLAAKLHDPTTPWAAVVAEVGGELVGLAVIKPMCGPDYSPYPESSWRELLFVAVAPAHRGKGVATAILNHCEGVLEGQGAEGWFASVSVAGTNWYERRGWTTGPPGAGFWYVDLRTYRRGLVAWHLPPDNFYPVWAWKVLPERGASAWCDRRPVHLPDEKRLLDAATRHAVSLGLDPTTKEQDPLSYLQHLASMMHTRDASPFTR